MDNMEHGNFDFLPQLDKMDAARRFASGKGLP